VRCRRSRSRGENPGRGDSSRSPPRRHRPCAAPRRCSAVRPRCASVPAARDRSCA